MTIRMRRARRLGQTVSGFGSHPCVHGFKPPCGRKEKHIMLTPHTSFSVVDFNVTIPDTLGEACSAGGKCAIQWYWFAAGKQTYESCVDFYVKA